MLFLEKLEQKKFYIISVIIICILMGILYTICFVPQKYVTRTSLTCLKMDKDSKGESKTSGSVELTDNLIATFEEIAKSTLTIKESNSKSNLYVESKDIKLNRISNSDTFSIQIKNVDSNKIIDFSNKLVEVFSKKAEKMLGNVEIYVIDTPYIESKTYGNAFIISIGISILIGLGIIFVYIIFLIQFDKKIKSVKEIESELSLRNLSSIPLSNKKRKTDLIFEEEDKSIISKAFKELRSNIQFVNVNNKGKNTILITSPNNFEGKSYIAANLAVSFAEVGKKVILIDGDMENGKQSKIFNIPNNLGFSNYLSNLDANGLEINELVNKFINETEFKNLNVITSGTIPPNSSELLASPKLIELIKDLSVFYDVLIIDGTKVLSKTDALILTRTVNSTILVSSCRKTKKDDLWQAKKDIQNVGGRIIGSILNKTKNKEKIKISSESKISNKQNINILKNIINFGKRQINKFKNYIVSLKNKSNQKLLEEGKIKNEIKEEVKDKKINSFEKENHDETSNKSLNISLKNEESKIDYSPKTEIAGNSGFKFSNIIEKLNFVNSEKDVKTDNIDNTVNYITTRVEEDTQNSINNLEKQTKTKENIANKTLEVKEENLQNSNNLADNNIINEHVKIEDKKIDDLQDENVIKLESLKNQENDLKVEIIEKNQDLKTENILENIKQKSKDFLNSSKSSILNFTNKIKLNAKNKDLVEDNKNKSDEQDEKYVLEDQEEKVIETKIEDTVKNEIEKNTEFKKVEESINEENINKETINKEEKIISNLEEKDSKINEKSLNKNELIDDEIENNIIENSEYNDETILVIVDAENGYCRAFNKYCFTEKAIRGIDPVDGFEKANYSSYLLKKRAEGLINIYGLTKNQAKRVDSLIYTTLTDFDETVWLERKMTSNKADAYIKCIMKEYEILPNENKIDYERRCQALRKQELRKESIEIEYKLDGLWNSKKISFTDKLVMNKFSGLYDIDNKLEFLKDNLTQVENENSNNENKISKIKNFITDNKFKNIVSEKINQVKENLSNIKVEQVKAKTVEQIQNEVMNSKENNTTYDNISIDEYYEEKQNFEEIDYKKVEEERKRELEFFKEKKREEKMIQRQIAQEEKRAKKMERIKKREEVKKSKEMKKQQQKQEARIEEELLVDNLYPKTKNNKDI